MTSNGDSIHCLIECKAIHNHVQVMTCGYHHVCSNRVLKIVFRVIQA